MINASKLLVPTDFSDGARIAYQYANDFALKFGGKVDLIHIVPSVIYLADSIKRMGLPFNMDKDLYPHLLDDTRKQAEEDLITYFDESIRGKVISRIESRVSDAISETAEAGDYSMIVMGARGNNAESIIHGSVTEKVIRNSDIPVMTVPGKSPKSIVKKIIVPIDFSNVSFDSVPFTISLTDSLDGELTLLHVLEMYGTESENIDRDMSGNENESIKALLLDRLESFLNKQQAIEAWLERTTDPFFDYIEIQHGEVLSRIKLKVAVIRGISAHYEITDYCSGKGDLLVMSTHGRSGLSHLLLGSTTEKVVQYATKPVITFRPEKHRK